MADTLPEHSKIGASGYYRWKACPGSVRLSEGIKSVSSAYAEEGTEAHEIAARCLVGADLALIPDSEMREAVSVYVNTVCEDIGFKKVGDEILVEHRFDLSSVYPGLYGTADCVYYRGSDRKLFVYDYKHGAGIPVEVTGNVQLQYYALGALLSLGYPCKEIEMVIVQPRCPHQDGPVRRWKIQSVEMIDFAADLRDAAVKTDDPNAEINPGDHCRFCPAAGICPALRDRAQLVAKEEFSQSLSYDPAKLSETLKMLPAVEAWAKSVREFAYQEALHGRLAPGFKLVQKRAIRRWKDETETIKWLTDIGLQDAEILTDPELKSPAQIEKVLSKDQKKLVGDFTVAESSGYTLAPESDKREPIKLDAKSEFSVIEETANERNL